MDHAFEDIAVKVNAPKLLEDALRRKRKRCMIGTGAMSDPYLPIEKELKLTRKCLELIDEYGFGLAIQTKSDLILRDLDLLKSINKKTKCVVAMTMTTYDEELCKKLEPNVCTTKERFEVLMAMKERGIPTIVWLSPFLPFINDTEENLRGLMDYCIKAGVYGIMNYGIGLTLREGSREYFYNQLDKLFPGMKEKYMRAYQDSYEVVSPNNDALMGIFNQLCEEHGIIYDKEELMRYMREYKNKTLGTQMSIFDFQ